MKESTLIPLETIEKSIYLIRGEKVMLDRYLAELYQVTTAALNQAVRRNRERFPSDFMFQLTPSEVTHLNRSQIVIGSQKHRDPRFDPTHSPSKASRCSLAFFGANAPYLRKQT